MGKLDITKKDWIYLIIITVCVVVIVLMSVLYITKPMDTYDDMSYYDKKCVSFVTQNANLSQGQIVFVGDSITDLYHLDDYYSDLSLATYNRGIGGDVTWGVLNRIQGSVVDLHPTKVVLMIGINDLNGGRSPESIVSNYNAILDILKSDLPTTEVYCMSIIPMNSVINWALPCDVNVRNEQIRNINSDLMTIVNDHGYEYIDLYSQVEDENHSLQSNLTDDGIHLNNNGFAIWTSMIKGKLSTGA